MGRQTATLGKILNRHAFLFIWALGTLLRLAQILGSRPHPARDLSELELTARSLILHGTLGNPYLHNSGPSAHVSPIAPLVLAVLYAMFGTDSNGQLAQRIAGAVAASAQYALLPAVAQSLGLVRIVGIVAGLAGALLPYKGYIETVDTVWEQPYVALVYVLLFLHTVQGWTKKNNGSAPARGLLWGFAILLSPTFGLVFVAVLAYEFFSMKRRNGLILVIACAALVQVPWIARNWIQLGGFVPARSNFGLEFSLSNRIDAHPLMEDNISDGALSRFHPSHNQEQWQQLREQGEVAYNRILLNNAVHEIASNPPHFLRLTGQHIWRFWWWPSHRKGTTLATLLVTALGLLGLRRLPATDARNLIGLILLAYPLIYYLIEVDRRYRYPIEWIFMLGAAVYLLPLSRTQNSPTQAG